MEYRGFLEPGMTGNQFSLTLKRNGLVKPGFQNISDTTGIGHKVLVSALCYGGYHLPRSDRGGWCSLAEM